MNLLDSRQLRAFAVLAETGSFTATADRLFLTQSAISHSIKALESQLDCTLVQRLGKNISLTAAGERLLSHTRNILRSFEMAIEDVATVSRPGYGRIRIGATQTVCQYILPSVVREFRECFPNCEVAIMPGDTTEILDLLEIGQIDVAFGLKVHKSTQFSYKELFEDDLCFVYSPLHPWESLKSLDATDISSQQFIVYSKRSLTTRLIEAHFQNHGLPMPSLIELGNMEAIKEFARIGVGVGIMAPWVAEKELSEASLTTRPLSKGKIRREWGAYTARNRELTMAEEVMMGLCEDVCRNLGSREIGSPAG